MEKNDESNEDGHKIKKLADLPLFPEPQRPKKHPLQENSRTKKSAPQQNQRYSQSCQK